MSHSTVSPPYHWPRPLRRGGTIGLVSTSGPSPDAGIVRAIDTLRERGYQVVPGKHVADCAELQGFPYLAGTDDDRLTDLNGFLADPSIDLILCARGGYGAARLLDRIDYAAARRDPKPLVGYSDVTALSLALAARAGIVSYSGIMATAGHGFGEDTLDPFSEASFWHAVADAGFPRLFASPCEDTPWTVQRAPASGSTVTGPLYPVCLSLLASLVGTPYVPDLSGAILVIEDIHEELYAIDRMLTHLRLSGILEGLAAILIGSFNGLSAEENARLATDVPRLCTELSPSTVVVASGVAYGHIPRRLTLPVGAVATVDLSAGTFVFSEPTAERDTANT